jgi:hypothetical protein
VDVLQHLSRLASNGTAMRHLAGVRVDRDLTGDLDDWPLTYPLGVRGDGSQVRGRYGSGSSCSLDDPSMVATGYSGDALTRK